MLQDVVREVADDGTTVFFSSHILEQVEAVADRIGILLDGEVVAEGDVDEMRAELGVGTTLSVWVESVPGALPGSLRSLPGVQDTRADDDRIEVRCDGDGETKLRVLNAVADAGVFRDFEIEEASLGDVFSKHTMDGRSGAERPPRRASR
jgi:ABC-2 type transport system ATP-binding protein